MSTIKFTNFQSDRVTNQPGPYELYSDISLDLKILNESRDLKASYDEAAVKNSVVNILNTRPGENFLLPDFGLNVGNYLFTQISEFNGSQLGSDIVASITKYEPRVSVLDVSVGVNIDAQQYTVSILLYIPTIGRKVSFNPVFTRDGLYFIKD